MKTWNDEETLLGIGLGSRPMTAGEVYGAQFRFRFAAGTPPGDVTLQRGGFEREPAADETIDSESPEYRTKAGSTTDTGAGTRPGAAARETP
ncbi:hypothetical protein ACFWJT_18735 [Streptomyces sp. NPDC127069]|uniref:hypothetical protein n=1 Tax=Streptomyces sp. NPDC127069 TaxID=3347128 RepID=UPI003664DC0B